MIASSSSAPELREALRGAVGRERRDGHDLRGVADLPNEGVGLLGEGLLLFALAVPAVHQLEHLASGLGPAHVGVHAAHGADRPPAAVRRGDEVVLLIADGAAAHAGVSFPLVALHVFAGLPADRAHVVARAGDLPPVVAEVAHLAAPRARASVPLVEDVPRSAPGARRLAAARRLLPVVLGAPVPLAAAHAAAAFLPVCRLVPLVAGYLAYERHRRPLPLVSELVVYGCDNSLPSGDTSRVAARRLWDLGCGIWGGLV